MAYTNNSFCWHGILTDDVARAATFFEKAIGWEIQTTPMGDEVATMVAAEGIPRAHISSLPMPGVPPHVSSFLRVEDVDAGLDKAVAAGGTMVAPAMDIRVGRFCTVASPSGAVFHLFHEADLDAAQDTPRGDLGIVWTELNSTDVQADLAWLEAAFGITHVENQMSAGPYYILMDGEYQVGGAMTVPMPDIPSAWIVWVQTPDVDATKDRVAANGGAVLTPPIDIEEVGRMYVVAEPGGAVFGITAPMPAE